MRKSVAVAVFSSFIALRHHRRLQRAVPRRELVEPRAGLEKQQRRCRREHVEQQRQQRAAGDCTNHEKVDDRPACDQCARANCCEFVLTCDKTPDCGELLKCLDECAGDVFCQLTCSSAHEKGGSVLSDVSSCAKSKCASECPASTPDAGDLFGDAF